jgi:hypothetical protein
MRRRHATALVATLALAGAGLALTARSATRTPPAAGASSLRFRPGFEYRYALTWKSEQRGIVGTKPDAAPELQGEVDLTGTLLLRGVSDDGKTSLVEARLEAGSQHEMMVLGHQVYPDAAAFAAAVDGRRVYMRVDHEGRVVELRFAPGDPSTYKDTMQWLLTQTQLVVPATTGPEWLADEEGPFGSSHTRYHRDGAAGAIVRDRLEYTRLSLLDGMGPMSPAKVASTGGSRGQIDADRQLTRLHIAEQVKRRDGKAVVATIDLDLALEDVRRSEVPRFDVDTLEAREPGETVVTDEMARRLALSAADGLTADQLLADLVKYQGSVPDLKRWMWRAVGVLELDPGNARLLLEPFATLSMAGKQLTLDLLASVGTPVAQEVMRSLLADPTLRQASEYPLLLQRLALVGTPEPENARYLVDSLAASRGKQADVSGASVVALGSTVGHLNQSTNPDYVAASEKYNQVLRDELAQSGDDEIGHVAAVMALGNTRLPENAPLVAGETQAASPMVRANAAVALRSFGDDASFDALVALLGDGERDVRQSALTSIGERTLSDPQVDRLVGAVLAGATNAELDTAMVGVLAGHLQASARMTAALRFIFERNPGDPRLQATILALLPHP